MIEVEWWDYDSPDEMAEAVAGDVGFIIDSALDARGSALIALPADEAALRAVVDQVIAAQPAAVADFRKGKKQSAGFLVGQVMKATQGKANPHVVNRLLVERLTPPAD